MEKSKPQASMKAALLAGLAIGSSVACAETTSDIACFSSDGTNPTHFEMRTYFDRDTRFSFASIRYAKARAAIPLVSKSAIAQARGHGQQDEMTTTWLEVADGAVSGTYRMVHQGTEVGSMTYTNARTHKTFEFFLDTHVDSTLENGCVFNGS